MKKIKVLGNVLFWLTLISPMISFSLAGMIGEIEVFGVTGIVRYSWLMLLFIPIGILSIIIGLKLKNNNQKYKKNLIIAFICLPLLIIFGSYRFIFSNTISYNTNKVSIIEDKIGIKLPNKIKVATEKLDLYNVSYVKIIDNECKESFEQSIKSNSLWKNKLNYEIRGMLPLYFQAQYESENFDYFVFYNITSNEYNTLPSSGEYECIFIAYDCDLQRLIILDDYKINLD
ncbi:MAG: hypothetical protein SOZ32_03870 [Bacilli bacterium]|nr:hypothetical protein [Bacilli bacterium]